MIEELREREPYKLPKEGFVRSKLNAGPTSIEDLVCTWAVEAEQATFCVIKSDICMQDITLHMRVLLQQYACSNLCMLHGKPLSCSN